MTEEEQQKCVSKAEVETHDEEKTATMCVQGGSGDTLRRENSNNVCQECEWKHMTKKKQQQCVSKV
ncbi:hypothetical protein BLX88_13160 [Bacillus obstructivus]|uniref:Uncharacterized protein n=1 Tax=Heyndrickxia oleronia TaxID=38875 RepID=A0A8E2LG49_9BACI|nr:hypothetical protein BLX88_13160 [Bacillus obstructivus]OOP70073.1 hypothetical protein BWZ43_01875 [Heyndrickxia oleronia]